MMDKDGDKVRNSQPLVIILPNSIHNHFPTVAYHATQIEPDWARYFVPKITVYYCIWPGLTIKKGWFGWYGDQMVRPFFLFWVRGFFILKMGRPLKCGLVMRL